MKIKKYDIRLVNLNPTKGTEQKGQRPCLVYQSNLISQNYQTYLVLPLTTNLKREGLFGAKILKKKENGLTINSIILCFQTKAVDKSGFIKKLGEVNNQVERDCIKEAMLNSLDRDDDFI